MHEPGTMMTGDKHDLPDDLSLGQSLPARPRQDEEMNVPSNERPFK